MTEIKEQLIARFENKEATIGIVGLGYVGLPLLLRFNEVGYATIGFDIDSEKIDAIESGIDYIERISVEPLTTGIENNVCRVTTDFSKASEADALILCVPTPLSKYREPDLSFVLNSLHAIIPHLRSGQVISLESTTYPGTTEEQLRPLLENAGWIVGDNMFLVYSPEREDPGNAKFNTQTIPKICGGTTENCLAVGVGLYGQVIDKLVTVSSTQAAEMTKILENTYRAVNVALVNELKLVAEKMNIDIFEVIRAASTKPFGFKAFYPGPGLGGHCIPIDPFYLTWKAREYGISTKFIELAGEVNTSMPDYVVGKVAEALSELGQAVKDSKILVLGVAYKKNVDDLRESPSIVLIEKLRQRGAFVQYSDPHVAKIPKLRNHIIELSSVEISENILGKFDCILIATDHDKFDWPLIHKYSNCIVDTRGVFEIQPNYVIRA